MRLVLGLAGRAAFLALLTLSGHDRPALVGGDHAVAVGVYLVEPLAQLGGGFGDHYWPAFASLSAHSVMRPAVTALTITGARRARTAIRAGGMASVELGAADGAVAVRVQLGEAVARAFGATGLHGGGALFGADHAVAVRIERGQTRDARINELGAGDLAVRIRTRMMRRGAPAAGAGGTCAVAAPAAAARAMTPKPVRKVFLISIISTGAFVAL